MKRSSIHVKSLAINAANISIETIDGDEHYVIRGVVPVVDDVVMNGGLYPAEEINKAYLTIEGNSMPAGHPKIGGEYVSANHPRAVNKFHIGAWAENVRKDDGRVIMDAKVNKRYANATDNGKRLIERLDDMMTNADADPIHVSTGLLLSREANKGKSKGKSYSWVARNMQFDHVAILLDEPGAATPDDGVGIFVNEDNSTQEVDVESVELSQASDCTREGLLNKTKFFFTNASNYSFDDIQSALSQKLREGKPDDFYAWPQSVWPDKFIYSQSGKTYQQKYLIDDDGEAEFVGEPVEVVRKPTEYEIKTNGESDPMKELIINALNAAGKPTEGKTDAELMDAFNQMKAEEADAKAKKDKPSTTDESEIDPVTGKPKKKESATNHDQMPAWAVSLSEKVEAVANSLNANSNKEKGDKRAAVKAKFGLEDVAVNALDGAALDGLYAQCQTSTGLNGSFRQVNSSQTFSEMPE